MMTFLGTSGIYEFHSLEIKKASPEVLQEYVEACASIESQVWVGRENFENYFKKQTALFYVKHDEKIVAFALFHLSIKGDSLIAFANECMVLPQHQGKGISSILMALPIAHIRYTRRARGYKRPYKRIIAHSMTVNYRSMYSFRKYRYIATSDSFSPCDEIKSITKEYLMKEGFVALSEENFCYVKGAFPGSLKETSTLRTPEFIPGEFDLTRGDALLYVAKVHNFFFLGVGAWLILNKNKFVFAPGIKKRIGKLRTNSITDMIYT